MDIKSALGTIRRIVADFKENQTADERLIPYSVILTIISRIDVAVKNETIPNYDLYKHELLWSCDTLCGLDAGNNLGNQKHISMALSAIQKLESYHCFNIN